MPGQEQRTRVRAVTHARVDNGTVRVLPGDVGRPVDSCREGTRLSAYGLPRASPGQRLIELAGKEE